MIAKLPALYLCLIFARISTSFYFILKWGAQNRRRHGVRTARPLPACLTWFSSVGEALLVGRAFGFIRDARGFEAA